MKTQNTRKKVWFFSFVTLGLFASFLDVNYWAYATSQDKEKVLEIKKDFNPPAAISLVESSIGNIEAEKKFFARKDWFKGLKFDVNNDSDKPINHITVNLTFPRAEKEIGKLNFVVPINYGESPFPSKDGQFLINTAKAIMPGESIELALTDQEYQNITALLKKSEYQPDIKKISLSVYVIGFTDKTIWMAGKNYKVDKDNPGKLLPLK